jgi:hypothetical protein
VRATAQRGRWRIFQSPFEGTAWLLLERAAPRLSEFGKPDETVAGVSSHPRSGQRLVTSSAHNAQSVSWWERSPAWVYADSEHRHVRHSGEIGHARVGPPRFARYTWPSSAQRRSRSGNSLASGVHSVVTVPTPGQGAKTDTAEEATRIFVPGENHVAPWDHVSRPSRMTRSSAPSCTDLNLRPSLRLHQSKATPFFSFGLVLVFINATSSTL